MRVIMVNERATGQRIFSAAATVKETPEFAALPGADVGPFLDAWRAKHPSVSGHQGRDSLREILNSIFAEVRDVPLLRVVA